MSLNGNSGWFNNYSYKGSSYEHEDASTSIWVALTDSTKSSGGLNANCFVTPLYYDPICEYDTATTSIHTSLDARANPWVNSVSLTMSYLGVRDGAKRFTMNTTNKVFNYYFSTHGTTTYVTREQFLGYSLDAFGLTGLLYESYSLNETNWTYEFGTNTHVKAGTFVSYDSAVYSISSFSHLGRQTTRINTNFTSVTGTSTETVYRTDTTTLYANIIDVNTSVNGRAYYSTSYKLE